MWFKKKSELEKLIISYDKDKDILLEFARSVQKPRIEDITLEDVKEYYKATIEPINSRFLRENTMKKVRIFFREHRSRNCLRASEIRDNPLILVENIAKIEYMPKEKEKERGVGRPRDIASIRKVVAFRKEGITFREIAKVLKKDVSQVWVWWDNREKLLS